MKKSIKQTIAINIAKHLGQSSKSILELIAIPPSLDKGDYTLPCFQLARQLKKKPNDIAADLAKNIKSKAISKIVATGPYLNIFLHQKDYQEEIISNILDEKTMFGHSTHGQNKKVLIEYSSPNIAKPFHIGHFRATIIGNALKNLFNSQGYKTVSINYLGDWGTQFGKLIAAFKKWGDEKKLVEHPITHLNGLYIKFHEEAQKHPELEDEGREWFKKCEEGNDEARRLWKHFREESLKEFNKIYDTLHISFDEISGESIYDEKIPGTVDKLKKIPETKKSEGALIVDLSKDNMPPALILKKDGASLYMTRDIAALFDRYDRHHFHKMLYVVGDTQALHFKQLFKVADYLGADWTNNCHHITFGQIRLKDQKMSSRKGTAILLEDLMSRATELIHKIIEEKNPDLKEKDKTAAAVAIAALIFADFNTRRHKNVIFDWDIILNPDGDTGPYVLYTYARASSILRKAGTPKVLNWTELKSDEEMSLFKHLESFPKTAHLACHQFEPSHLATYLIDLSKHFNRFYHHHRVIQDDVNFQSSRLQLVKATRHVLQSGLDLMGIRPVEQL